MTAKSQPEATKAPAAGRSGYPPGKAKIMAALTALLGEKEFVSITTAEIDFALDVIDRNLAFCDADYQK